MLISGIAVLILARYEGGKKNGPQVVRHPRPGLVAKGELLMRDSVSLAAAGG